MLWMGPPGTVGQEKLGMLHNFGVAAGQTNDTTMDFRLASGANVTVLLQWNDAFGTSSNNYDLLLQDEAGGGLASSTNTQDGNDDPEEALFFANNSVSEMRMKVVIRLLSGEVRRLEMFFLSRPSNGVVVDEYRVPAGSIFGHPAVVGVLATGAIDASNVNVEPFTSQGPARIDFPAPESRPKPDIAATDGVLVSGAGSFRSPFFGTSAAAPHVAGIAALLKSAVPTATAAAIREAIRDSAVDVGLPGTDSVTGAGLIDAFAAAGLLTTLLANNNNDDVGSFSDVGLVTTARATDPSAAPISSSLRAVLSRMSNPTPADATARNRRMADFSNPLVRVGPAGDVQTYVYVTSYGAAEASILQGHGVVVDLVDDARGIVQAWLPFAQVEIIARLPFVTRITPASYATPRVGSVTTEGDLILQAVALRDLGFRGSGVKVGVIGPGLEGLSTAQASGDLPEITEVEPIAPSIGEGTALLEIVHDIAPEAELAFCGPATSLEMVDCIEKLVRDFGAEILVDDLGFFGEPYFEDGPVAQAVAEAVANGVIYVSAAGNDAETHYEADFVGFDAGDDDGGGGGGGCTLRAAAGFDGTLLGLFVCALVALGWRQWRRQRAG